MSTHKKPRFCEACPLKLNSLPNSPCPLALERIHAIQASGEGKRRRETDNLPGCPWYVTSAEHNYCFWKMIQDRTEEDGQMEPAKDKEICDLLMLSQAQYDKAYQSALAKLRSPKMKDVVIELAEMAAEIEKPGDNGIYMPDEFRAALSKSLFSDKIENEEDSASSVDEDANLADIPEPKKTKKRVDLYGLYSDSTLERLKREGKTIKNQNTKK